MDRYQQFATGFITQCVHDGLTLDQMKKVADDLIVRAKQANIIESGLSAAKLPLLLAAVAPPLIGAGLGHGFAKMTDANPKAEVDDVKSNELINAYKTETDRLSRLTKLQRAARRVPRQAAL